MSSTYSALYYHVIFGTHNREPWIDAKWRPRLHEYLGGTIHGLGGVSCEVGGVADHVHLLVSLRPTHPIPDVVRELKKASNDFVRTEFASPAFAWQDGYGVFTVSPGLSTESGATLPTKRRIIERARFAKNGSNCSNVPGLNTIQNSWFERASSAAA